MRASAKNRARREGYAAGLAWLVSKPIPRCPYTNQPIARVWWDAFGRGGEARFAGLVARIMQPMAAAWERMAQAAKSAFLPFATGDWLTLMGEQMYNTKRKAAETPEGVRSETDDEYRTRMVAR